MIGDGFRLELVMESFTRRLSDFVILRLENEKLSEVFKIELKAGFNKSDLIL